MRVFLLAGFFSAVLAPSALAIEDTKACQLDEMRRSAEESPRPPAPAAVRQAEATPPAAASEPARAAPPRRRGKRIPDSELIGPRGAL